MGFVLSISLHTIGELGKNPTSSKRRICRIREDIRELTSGWKILFHDKENTLEDILMNVAHFANLLMIRENNG
jgi:hypothetical protein